MRETGKQSTRAGSRARPKVQRLGRCPVGVRRFKSGPAHTASNERERHVCAKGFAAQRTSEAKSSRFKSGPAHYHFLLRRERSLRSPTTPRKNLGKNYSALTSFAPREPPRYARRMLWSKSAHSVANLLSLYRQTAPVIIILFNPIVMSKQYRLHLLCLR